MAKYVDIIKTKLIDLKPDGSVFLNQEYFNYATGLKMVYDDKWEALFGFPKGGGESMLDQRPCDLALAIQTVTEEAVLYMAEEAKRLTGADYLCMAGGVALNCVANGKLDDAKIFKQIFIQPAAGDAGGALGAAYAAHYIYFGKERKVDPTKMDALQGSYLGTDTIEQDIRGTAGKYKAHFKR